MLKYFRCVCPDLPQRVSKGSDNISYIYSATGTKLAMLNGTAVDNYYAGTCVYKGDRTLDYALHPEGVVRATEEGLSYEYFLKDHLGSTRVVFSSTGAVLQTTDYYAFGMAHAPLPISNANRYLYNGKEQQDATLGGVRFDWYDYGARFYDPQIGRFTTIDPWVEKYNFQSPYVYAYNNPVRFTDYLGLGADDEVKKLEKAAQKGVQKAEEEEGKVNKNGEANPACNVGVSAAFEEKTGKKDLNDKNANQIVDHISSSPDWAEVSMDQVQEIANSGDVVVAGTKGDIIKDKKGNPVKDENGNEARGSGHVAMGVPGTEQNSSWGKVPMVMDTGRNRRTSSQRLSLSWSKSEKDNIRYFKYIGDKTVPIQSQTIVGSGKRYIEPLPAKL